MRTEKHLLLFDMHHIISDGVSMGILVEEFTKLYAGKSCRNCGSSTRITRCGSRSVTDSEAMRKQEAYWLETFAGELPVLQLPDGLSKASGAALRRRTGRSRWTRR